MSVLIATDAWRPQVNGVVRTLTSLEKACARLGVEVRFLTPEGFPSFPVPTYPGLRLAMPSRREVARRVAEAGAEAIHIATEGPIGWSARAYCRRRGLAFTTCYATRFPEYVSLRTGLPDAVGYALMRQFHAAAASTMVATTSLREELAGRGFRRLSAWTRGVDTELFNPGNPASIDLPRPIFMSVGRIAVEKNLEAFLSLDLPGSKVVIGDGPQLEELKRRFPQAAYLGEKTGKELASHIAAADVFVFPSVTDTFGIVQLEALACGVPVAAFPVTGPLDLVADRPIGALDNDLKSACLRALGTSRELCRDFALTHSWENCARQFINNLVPAHAARARRPATVLADHKPVRG
jgi:1,2-diacylglycerol 3-alpha-glucosyltransferase/glucuronosyltransferase